MFRRHSQEGQHGDQDPEKPRPQWGSLIDPQEDNRTGLLVTPSDVEGLTHSIIKIMKDSNFAAYLAENAYDKLKQHFTLDFTTIPLFPQGPQSFQWSMGYSFPNTAIVGIPVLAATCMGPVELPTKAEHFFRKLKRPSRSNSL